MEKIQAAVKEMMVALSLPLPHEDAPGVERLNIGLLRRLVKEEAHEFDESPPRGPQVMQAWADVIDGICDVMVVVNNTSNAMGLDVEPFFDEVHKTNMVKVGGPKNEFGKALKPEGWKPPRIREMLEGLVRES
jgi:predicted HAD superfamily Cof-like phosphohydrolase